MKTQFDQLLKTVEAMYKERSLVDRIKVLVNGLKAPVSTKEYKEAKIEAQRLSAPTVALAVPLLAVLFLVLFASDANVTDKNAMEATILADVEEPPELEDVDMPVSESQSDAPAEVTFDLDAPVTEVEIDSVVAAPSPVRLSTPMIVRETGLKLPKGIFKVGIGSSLGGTNQYEGDLVGHLYDFKRTGDGRPRETSYWPDLQAVVKGKLSAKAFSSFYRVPKEVYLSHLFVPYAAAETGPEAFGVAGLMEATKWVAHYAGQLQPLRSGKYRFVGDFDDVLIVLVDGKVVLEVTWDHADNMGGASGWRATENVGKYKCFTGRPLVFGDWVQLDETKPRRIDILVGERPGGRIGGILLVQQEGVEYANDSAGRPVLPVFTVSLLSPLERQRLLDFKEMTIARSTPVMRVSGGREAHDLAFRQEGDVDVITGDL